MKRFIYDTGTGTCHGTDRIEETRSLCSSVRKIDRCRAWINSESLRMTGTCPCVIPAPSIAGTETGNAVENENIVRRELKLPERIEEEKHHE